MEKFTLNQPYGSATQACIARLDWEVREIHFRLFDADDTELSGRYVVGPIPPETTLDEHTAPTLIEADLLAHA